MPPGVLSTGTAASLEEKSATCSSVAVAVTVGCAKQDSDDRRVSLAGTGARSRSHVLNVTARRRRAAHTDVVPKETKPQSLSDMKPGDILVSHSTGVREHAISVVPNARHATSPTHDVAVSDGRSAADAMGVDAWLTEDQTHVVKIASHRAPDE
jgi:hypothetical protein